MTLDVDARASVKSFALAVRFTAGPGITVIRGPSASGKTLALRLVAGLERVTVGHLRFDGAAWDAPPAAWIPPQARGIGYSPQHAALWPHRSVRDQLLKTARDTELSALPEALGLAPLLDRFPSNLSGGERQRVALARALLRAPRLLLLDEPWSAIDRDGRRAIADALKRWVHERGAVALLVTHDSEDVHALADREVPAEGGVIGRRSGSS